MTWFILSLSGEVVKCILRNKKYIVGRLGGDIVANDKSVSRKHAEVSLDSENNSLIIKDFSKYGTYVNQTKCDKNTISCFNEDIIQFGCQPGVYFKVKEEKLNVISLFLSSNDLDKFKSCTSDLGANIKTEFDDFIDYLVMSEIKPHFYTCFALLHNIPIVTVDFFIQLLDYHSGVTHVKPDLYQYKPPILDDTIKNIDLKWPHNLFDSWKFYILSEPSNQLVQLINSLSGTLITIDEFNEDLKKDLMKKNCVFLLTSNIMDNINNCNKILLENIAIFYQSIECRIILEEEVVLACLLGDVEKYCNVTLECESKLVEKYKELIYLDSLICFEKKVQKDTIEFLPSNSELKFCFVKHENVNNETDDGPDLTLTPLENNTNSLENDDSNLQIWQRTVRFNKDDNLNTRLSKLDDLLDNLEVPELAPDKTLFINKITIDVNEIFPKSNCSNKENIPKQIPQSESINPAIEIVPTVVIKRDFEETNEVNSLKNVASTTHLTMQPPTATVTVNPPKTKTFKKTQTNVVKEMVALKPHNK